jgi:hypothetical protein
MAPMGWLSDDLTNFNWTISLSTSWSYLHQSELWEKGVWQEVSLGAFLFRIVQIGGGAAVDVGVQEGTIGQENLPFHHVFMSVYYRLKLKTKLVSTERKYLSVTRVMPSTKASKLSWANPSVDTCKRNCMYHPPGVECV